MPELSIFFGPEMIVFMSFSFWGYVVAVIVTIAYNGTYVKQEREQQRRQQQLQMLRSRVDRRCLLSIPFASPGYGGLAYELSSPNLLLVPRQASIPWGLSSPTSPLFM